MVDFVTLGTRGEFEIRLIRQQGAEHAHVIEYLNGLEVDQRKKLVRRIQRMAAQGPLKFDQTRSRALKGTDGLFELKEKPSRIVWFYAGPGVIVMTHGFTKRTDRTPSSELERAQRLRAMYWEHVERP